MCSTCRGSVRPLNFDVVGYDSAFPAAHRLLYYRASNLVAQYPGASNAVMALAPQAPRPEASRRAALSDSSHCALIHSDHSLDSVIQQSKPDSRSFAGP